MPTVVDHLITRHTLDSKGYVQGAKQVLSSTQGIASKIGSLAGTAGALSVTGMVAFAVNSAVSFDTLTRSLTAVTKSGERAAKVLSFVDKLAIPSVFDSEALAQAATTLEAFGLTTERWLPIVEKLGTVFGGTSGDLMQFVNAIGMIKAGRAGEGLEALGRAGVSRDALKLRGIEFDKGGSLKSEIGALMQAVEAEVNQRFGNLGEVMGGGAAAKFASFTDAMKRGMRDVGNAILTFALPYVERLASWLQEMTQSGQMEKFGQRIVSVFEAVSATLSKVWSILSLIPTPILGIGIAIMALKSPISTIIMLSTAMKASLVEAGTKGAAAMAVAAGKMILLSAAIGGALYIAEGLREWSRRKDLEAEVEGEVPYYVDEIDPKTGKKRRRITTEEERKESRKRIRAEKAKAKLESETGIDLDALANSGTLQTTDPIASESVRVLRAIESNTAPIREMMQYIFGGGELGRSGVSVASMRGGGGSTSKQLRQLRSIGVIT